MLGKLKVISILVIAVLATIVLGIYLVQSFMINPRVEGELRNNPQGTRAEKVMLVSLPDGRKLPANYLREGNKVFIGVDGRWWRQFRGDGARVSLLIRGETLPGVAVAIEDDPAYRDEVFSRLRPTVPEWLPSALNGVLVEVTLDSHSE